MFVNFRYIKYLLYVNFLVLKFHFITCIKRAHMVIYKLCLLLLWKMKCIMHLTFTQTRSINILVTKVNKQRLERHVQLNKPMWIDTNILSIVIFTSALLSAHYSHKCEQLGTYLSTQTTHILFNICLLVVVY